MKKIELPIPRGDIEKFIKLNNVCVNQELSFGKNESIDGTGQNPSVNKREANKITNYILNKFEVKI